MSEDFSIGYGTKVSVLRSSATDYHQLIGILDVTFPQATADEIDVTHMQSPGRAKQFISGLTDNGEVTLTMLWIPGSETDKMLRECQKSGEIMQIKFETANGLYIDISVGFLKGYAGQAPVNEKQTIELTFRLSGSIEPEETP